MKAGPLKSTSVLDLTYLKVTLESNFTHSIYPVDNFCMLNFVFYFLIPEISRFLSEIRYIT